MKKFLALVASVSLAGVAHADPVFDGKLLQHGSGIELGAVIDGGASEFAHNDSGLSPDVQGLVIRDRNGVTSRMVIGLVIAIGSAMAQAGPKSVETKEYQAGGYRIRETTTTYYSEAEKAAMQANTNEAIDGLFSAKYSDFEMHLYSRDMFGRGESSGYKINMYVGGGDTYALETGLGFGVVDSIVANNGTPTRIDYKYLGMPFRLSGVAGPVRLALSYEWNWLRYGVNADAQKVHPTADGMGMEVRTTSHPWHLEASTVVLGRLAIAAGVTAQHLEAKFGYFASAGLLF
ncbi:MAG: hypothetical protein NT062_26180 [Proteobacteria bacterium]|nr:hypothetical protein [Pseudomonadota bacterium]